MTTMTGQVAGALDRALAERTTLIELCVYAIDRARSAGVAERVVDGLRGVGVSVLRPVGCRFDPAWHEAGGTVPTDDPELHGIVADIELVGFADRGRLLRPPGVVVYQFQG